MKGPRLSIVIACYNDPDVLTAIRSAGKQTYANKEIIVVDDGSDEVTREIINSVNGEIDILIRQENSGQSIARNKGIEAAGGEYILNLDSDDHFEPVFSEKAIAIFEKEKKVRIVTCNATRFTKKKVIDVFTPRGGKIKDFLFQNSALGSSMFRRKDWERCGGYEERLPILGFEDWEFYIQILKDGGYAAVIDEPLFHYQIRKDSITARIKDEKQEKFRHIILKHRELYKENFDDLVENLFQRIGRVESEKVRISQKPDFRIGQLILKPVRFIRSLKR